MLFRYPDHPHQRKHGPVYASYPSYKDWLRDEFAFRCVYCLERERWYPSGQACFGIDHVKPQSDPRYQMLACDYRNLVYACNRCNCARQDLELIDPCLDAVAEQLIVGPDGIIESLTLLGKDLIDILGLDLDGPTEVRRHYLRILALFRQFSDDPEIAELYRASFGFPLDLPNLAALQPQKNSRPEGLRECYWQQREEGRLPNVYF